MAALDCFDIGFQAFLTQHYYHSIAWFELALSRYMTQDNQNQAETLILLESLVKAYMRESMN